MNKIKKHADIVNSYEEFETNIMNGVYVEPWVVYIKNNDGTYEIKYSNDVNRTHFSATPDSIDILNSRLTKLEEEKVFCTENDYDRLVAGEGVYITDINTGMEKLVYYNDKHLYYIIEK